MTTQKYTIKPGATYGKGAAVLSRFIGKTVTLPERQIDNPDQDGDVLAVFAGDMEVGTYVNVRFLEPVVEAAGDTIAFEDIRVGDVIEGTYHHFDGELTRQQGTVMEKDKDTLYTAQHRINHYPSYPGRTTFRLIERPKAELPTEVGTYIIATVDGVPDQTLVRRGADFWFNLTSWRGLPVDRMTDITDWTLAHVVPVATD